MGIILTFNVAMLSFSWCRRMSIVTGRTEIVPTQGQDHVLAHTRDQDQDHPPGNV